jgi:hypothetical protein
MLREARGSVRFHAIEWAGISAILFIAIIALCFRMSDRPDVSRATARQIIFEANADLNCDCSVCRLVRQKGDVQ